MTMLERLDSLMADQGTNAKKVTEHLGISSSSFTDWRKGKGKPSLETVVRLAEMFHVSLDWLVLGKEDSSETTVRNASDMSILSKYRSLSDESKSRVMDFIEWTLSNEARDSDEEKRLSS